jgi:cytochrome b561
MIKRYNKAMITLHWLMAICFIGMIAGGLVMTGVDLPKPLMFDLYQYHKSLGVILLLLFFVRLSLKLFTKSPHLPAEMSAKDKKLAKIGHYALYVIMLAMPFSGWVMVSSSSYGLPTIVFGAFEWPHLSFVVGNNDAHELAQESHEWLAYGFMALIATHIAAVAKHYFIDGKNLLPRMGIGKICLIISCLIGGVANAKIYNIDYASSHIQFSGEHAGKKFTGDFPDWRAEIEFDKNDLSTSFVRVSINPKSAKTGNAMYDGTLPSKDWFDVVNHSIIHFRSTEIAANPDGSFKMTGDLTIKKITKRINFNFMLTESKQEKISELTDFKLKINRLDFNIGKESDAEAEWVSRDIDLNVRITTR